MSGIDRTATMTSNTAPSPNAVSASGQSDGPAYAAFDKADSQWIDHTTSNWLKYDFGSGNAWASDEYKMLPQTSGRMPKNWTFEGSNDDTNWTTLDTRTNITWTFDVLQTFTFSNTTTYRYYRLNVSANNGNEYTEIDELNIFAPDSTTTSTSTSTSTSSTTTSTTTTTTSTSTSTTTTTTSTSTTTTTTSTSTSTSTSTVTTTTSTSTSTSTSTTTTITDDYKIYVDLY